MKIRTKLLGGFGVVLILMLSMGGIAFYMLSQVEDANIQAIDQMENALFIVEREVDHLFWISNLANSFLLDETFTGQLDYTQCSLGRWYYALLNSPEYRNFPPAFQQTFAQLEEPHRKMHESAQTLIAIRENRELGIEEIQQQTMTVYSNETMVHLRSLQSVIKDLNDYYQEYKDIALAEANYSGELAERIIIIVSSIAVVIGIIIALIINRGITNPINLVVESLKAMAESGGDLTKRINVSSKDEVGDLAFWFNSFIEKLHNIILQIKNSANSVATASEEISIGNQDLSQRTEEQASSLEEIASTIEEVASSIQLTAGSSREADNVSRGTVSTVRDGEKVVEEMEEAMSSITSSSQEIAKIISTVNDIAFQTNLLALNAAVEAARAGEQGRGFAVVAAEVRDLARRSAEAAKEIEGLIKTSITRVEKGSGLMTETKRVLTNILSNTEKASQIVTEIAGAMSEQSAGATDIRSAIDELNMVTQQNASLVEEIASSSEAMSSEATEMISIVGQFKLNDGGKKTSQKKENTSKSNKATNAKSWRKNELDDAIFNEDDFDKF